MRRFIFAVCCVITASILAAQTRPGSLATLIQKGDRKAALERIRAGADVNEAQPDGTRPIHWAVFKVDYELLDALIAKQAKAAKQIKAKKRCVSGPTRTVGSFFQCRAACGCSSRSTWSVLPPAAAPIGRACGAR